jgi:serine/threonine protein kinase
VFVAVTALLALSDASMRAQWNEPRAIGAFGLHAGCVFAAAAVGIGGGHLVARYRHALREARTLARYDLVRLVGRGGMGEIWQARDRMLGRDVALKILRPDRDDERALARFAREVVKTASLRHPHTIRVFDYGKSDDGRAYYSMELLDGRDLAALVAEEGPLEASRAVEIARQAAEALGEAHSAGIVHRDVKPENIFLLRAGGDFVKVLDFGLAKVDDAGPALTSVGCIVGTPSCIAPEIVRAAPADPRTDVYALGCVLYFLLTGSTPFSGSTHDILTAHVRTPPEFPSVRLARRGSAERIDRAIERVVMRCLEKQPASRFQTAGELAQALTACAAERDAERTLADVCVTDALQVRNEDADTVPARCSTMPG